MILRRFMHHIREQNWFAVGLDVIVVIVGIFLGLQVQNWYEDQQNRASEATYLNRLHLELEELIRPAGEYYNSRQEILEQLKSLSDLINSADENLILQQDQCAALAVSHVYTNRFVQLPTVNELLSSGQLGIIKSEEVRNRISQYTLRLQSTTSLLANLQQDQLDLSRTYPQIINLESYMSSSAIEAQPVTCDFDKMKSTHDFNNALLGNTSRYVFFVRYLSDQHSYLLDLHNAVDQVLSINHGDNQS